MSTHNSHLIESRVAQLRVLIMERETLLREYPDDFGAKLALSSMKSHLEDLQSQLGANDDFGLRANR